MAGAADLEGVLEVEDMSFTNPWTREMYLAELDNPTRCHVLVVRSHDQPVVGFCSFWLVVDEIHVNNLAIRPGYRRQGAGALLVRALLDRAEHLGARRATLEVRASNLDAQRLYERVGFRLSGRRTKYYTNPVEDALIFWWDRSASG
jgi:ribosomal-protein-alanine N-acetyltransferase